MRTSTNTAPNECDDHCVFSSPGLASAAASSGTPRRPANAASDSRTRASARDTTTPSSMSSDATAAP
jgi:hypothetical protein